MPETWDCATSKFCYSPSGHVITGNCELINDKRLRSLLNKGPKYRIPYLIDFNSCRGQIEKDLQGFGFKLYCKKVKSSYWLEKNNLFVLLTNASRFITQICIFSYLPVNPELLKSCTGFPFKVCLRFCL